MHRIVLLILLLTVPASANDLPGQFHLLVAGTDEDREATRLALAIHLCYDLPRTAELPAADLPAIEDVRAALKAPDILDRILGAAAAARLGSDSRGLLPEIIAGLDTDCDPLRYWLTEAIRRLGPDASAAAPKLAELLHRHADWSFSPKPDWTPDANHRDAASLNLLALDAIGPEGLAAARESLVGRSYVRPQTEMAIHILVRLQTGTPVPEWQVPEQKHPPSREEQFDSWKIDKAKELPALMRTAASGSGEQSREALTILEWLGPHARKAAPRLFELLSDEDYQVRTGAADALGETGWGDPAWVPELVLLLDDPDVRSGVVKTLGAIGPPAAPALDKLVSIMLDPDSEDLVGGPWDPYQDASTLLRAAAARAIGRIGGAPDDLVPHLLTAGGSGAAYYPPPQGIRPFRGPPWHRYWRREHVELAEVAADAIGALGLDALPALRNALARGDEQIRAAAALALSRFSAEGVTETVVRVAADPSPAVRKATIPALLGAGNEVALRTLSSLLSDSDAKVREAALEGVEQLGPAAEVLAPGLVPVLTGGSREEASRALETLWKITSEVEGFLVPATAAALDRHPELAGSIAWRLGKLGPRAIGAVESLAGAVARCYPGDRQRVCEVLGKIDPAHPAAARVFRVLATDEDSKVQREALQQIQLASQSDPETVAVLIALLGDPQVAGTAARILTGLESESPEALAALASLAPDASPGMQTRVAAALAAAGRREEATAILLPLIDAEKKGVRKSTFKTIAALGNVAEAFEALKKRVEIEDGLGVKIALWPALASTGPEGTALLFNLQGKAPRGRRFMIRDAIPAGREHAVPRLREWLRSRNSNTRYSGAVLLGKIGAPAHVAIPDLVRLAESGRSSGLSAAIYGLSLMSAPPDVMLPLLRRGLRGSGDERLRAAQALEGLGSWVGSLVPDFAQAIPIERFLSLYDLLDALGEVGVEALPALPYLLATIPGSRAGERAKLTECLGWLAAFSEVPQDALLASLEDPSPRVRLPAVEALAANFAGDAEVVSRLGRHLEDPDEGLRLRTAELLLSLGEAALPALADIAAAGVRGERRVSRICLLSLAGMPTAAPLVRPHLVALTSGPAPWRAHDALAAMGRLRSPASETFEMLRVAVNRFDWRIRTGAVRGLIALADRSAAARALLASLENDPCLPVRVACQRADR